MPNFASIFFISVAQERFQRQPAMSATAESDVLWMRRKQLKLASATEVRGCFLFV
jgi:hypothetical protein